MCHLCDGDGRRRLSGINARSLSFHAIIISGIALLTVVLTYPLILHLTTHIPYNKDLDPSADNWIFMWALGFIEHLVVESQRWSLFTDAILYPRGIDLTYPALFGFGLPFAVSIPFVYFLGPILTYNLFVIGSFILTAYSTFLLARHLTNDSRASFIAGSVFAFSPYHMARSLVHFNLLTSGMWIPLYILFFIRAVNGGRMLDLVTTPLILALVLASNPYYAVFLVFFTVMYVFYHTTSNRGPIIKSILLKRLLSIGWIGALLFLPLAGVIVTHAPQDYEFYLPISASFHWGADLLAFFVPSRDHPLWGDLVKPIYARFAGNDTEQTIYIGYMVLILALIAILRAPKEKTRFWFLSALAFFVLALGPFLCINGKNTLMLDGMPITLPLPYLLLHFLPGVRAMRVSSRLSVMLMLALAVLVGYGAKYVLQRIDGWSMGVPLCMGLIVTIIAFEFFIVPLPIVDARIPRVYEKIAKEGGKGRTLLDVPLRWNIFRYEYYQTTHRKRLLLGQAPRLSLSLITTYADSVPFMKLFKNPELIKDYDERSVDRRDILRFIEFFDLSFIVLHKGYLGPEVFDRLRRFLLSHFPITHVEDEDNVVALQLARELQDADLWVGKEGYLLDFGSAAPQFFLSEGWSEPERWGDLTVAWSDAKESQLWVYFARVEDLTMELSLFPFTFPGSPPQAIKIYANGRFVSEIQLEGSGWRQSTVHLSRAYLTRGINTFRFAYRYTASPSQVLPSSEDTRILAVAFDFVVFHPR